MLPGPDIWRAKSGAGPPAARTTARAAMHRPVPSTARNRAPAALPSSFRSSRASRPSRKHTPAARAWPRRRSKAWPRLSKTTARGTSLKQPGMRAREPSARRRNSRPQSRRSASRAAPSWRSRAARSGSANPGAARARTSASKPGSPSGSGTCMPRALLRLAKEEPEGPETGQARVRGRSGAAARAARAARKPARPAPMTSTPVRNGAGPRFTSPASCGQRPASSRPRRTGGSLPGPSGRLRPPWPTSSSRCTAGPC